MTRHHLAAALLGWPLVALVVVDTVVHGLTGRRTWITDDAQLGPLADLATSLWMAAAFVALFVVLRAERDRFAAAHPVARGARRVLLVCLLLLAAGVGVVSPVLRAAGIETGLAYDLSGLLALVTVVTFSLSAFVLSLAVLRRNPLGWGGRILPLLLPVGALTLVVGLLLGGTWASPAYCSVVTVVGLSLLGVGAPSPVVPHARSVRVPG